MDAHDLTAAYALDALDPEEVETYERHLSQCEECREQLAEHPLQNPLRRFGQRLFLLQQRDFFLGFR